MTEPTPRVTPQRFLVLGGSGFVGQHVVQAALARGHAVTVLDRGLRVPDLAALHPGHPDHAPLTHLRGDRDADLSALAGRPFDVVVDASGYTAAQMQRLADALRPAAARAHWVYVSSISVYASFPPGRDYDETAPTLSGEAGYGAHKARAEEALHAAWPAGQQAVVRPALIVGPGDPTGRFSYWPLRAARGGTALAPGEPERRVQFIDVRDLAAWLLDLGERRQCGCFNAVAPALPMGQLLAACDALTGAVTRWTWCPDEVLLAAGVQPWTGLPLWLPGDDPDFGGFQRASNARAVAAGLRFRPVADTLRDTLAWARTQTAPLPKQVATLSAEREAEILAGGPSAAV